MQGLGYKDLLVWQRAMGFGKEVLLIVENLELSRKHYRLIEQIESASTSVAANIAEGKGRNSKKEYKQFLYIARGSLYEALTFLELLHNMSWLSKDEYNSLESKGIEIAKMLKGLINSIN